MSIWTIYLNLLALLQQCMDVPLILSSMNDNVANLDNDKLPLLPGLQDLPINETDMYYYMGGVGNGTGLCKST
ncbi:hypothetical protein PAXRUDRAFT_783061, partial [Paxillus rubicundulus Ve08.2h10]